MKISMWLGTRPKAPKAQSEKERRKEEKIRGGGGGEFDSSLRQQSGCQFDSKFHGTIARKDHTGDLHITNPHMVKLRIIIKPKPCIGVGPLCTAQQVSKLGKVKNENHSVQDVKADDLRQMFLAMTEEVRVIIVKLADRMHNMPTLSHMPPHKQSSIAMETLQVFAPLAKLLGMYQIKVAGRLQLEVYASSLNVMHRSR